MRHLNKEQSKQETTEPYVPAMTQKVTESKSGKPIFNCNPNPNNEKSIFRSSVPVTRPVCTGFVMLTKIRNDLYQT